jgi:hypothetical protein
LEDEWRNTYDYFEQKFKRSDWLDFIKIGEFHDLINDKQVSSHGKQMIILEKSIELEGMQYPLPVRMNRSEQRLEFWSGMRRIRYAMIHDYTSIDAIVLEDTDKLYNLQVKLFESADKHFSKIPEYEYNSSEHPFK